MVSGHAPQEVECHGRTEWAQEPDKLSADYYLTLTSARTNCLKALFSRLDAFNSN